MYVPYRKPPPVRVRSFGCIHTYLVLMVALHVLSHYHDGKCFQCMASKTLSLASVVQSVVLKKLLGEYVKKEKRASSSDRLKAQG